MTETSGQTGGTNEQVQVRREKYDRLVAAGTPPYALGYPRTATLAELRERYANLDTDTATGDTVSVAGRVMLSRTGGKLGFATIAEGEAQVQVMVSLDGVGEDALGAWKSDVDLGDHVGVTGEVISSRRGELSVLASSWQLTSKALRPLPDKHAGLTDPEARVRQRYVDLIVNPEARRVARERATVVRSLRATLDARGHVEVETPILQVVHGGAAARPFVTHVNALDLDVTLRIATELFLKRLVVGGLHRVYELSKTFRNEGIDSTHFPEFTELEVYEAYGDYDTMAELTRELILTAAGELGRTTTPSGIDLTEPWRHATLHGLVGEAVGQVVTPDSTREQLVALATEREVALQEHWDAGEVLLELYEQLVEHTLVAPTFVRDYPASVRPLARPHRDDPRLTEAWDLIVDGVELGAAYSELIDPVEQRRRLTEQSLRAAGGDPDAMALDEDFLRALEHGMPPTGGLGLGVDRIVMLLTGLPIRETILFPLVRPVG